MLKRKKTKTEDTKANVPEPVFKVHRMPKGYKSGRFESSAFSSSPSKEKSSGGSNKKVGLLIISLGSITVVFLIYIIISYLSQPDFSLGGIFKFKSSNTAVKPSPVVLNEKEPAISLINEEEPVVIEEEEDLELDLDIEEDLIIDEENNMEEEVEVSVSFLDSDGDGLSDQEEVLIGTNPLESDSDGDGYDDFTEVSNLYNPLGSGLLKDNRNIQELQDDNLVYSVLYPSSLEPSISNDGHNTLFFLDDNSFIQILLEENEGQQNITSWYGSRFFSFIDNSEIIEKDTWSGFYTSDGSSFYLGDHDRKYVFTILYNFPENQNPLYMNIFKMMINSFQLK